MSRLVVDTDVVSFLFKNHPIAKLYDAELLGHTLMNRVCGRSAGAMSNQKALREERPSFFRVYFPLLVKKGLQDPKSLRSLRSHRQNWSSYFLDLLLQVSEAVESDQLLDHSQN
jgi:hypothetical protein